MNFSSCELVFRRCYLFIHDMHTSIYLLYEEMMIALARFPLMGGGVYSVCGMCPLVASVESMNSQLAHLIFYSEKSLYIACL